METRLKTRQITSIQNNKTHRANKKVRRAWPFTR